MTIPNRIHNAKEVFKEGVEKLNKISKNRSIIKEVVEPNEDYDLESVKESAVKAKKVQEEIISKFKK